jgi:hypothetical protein
LDAFNHFSPLTDQQIMPDQNRTAVVMTPSQRWSIYALIIVAATFAVAGRIVMVRSKSNEHPLPTLSANDRSRWLTVWSLGEYGTYEWDAVFNRMPEEQKRYWNSIDRVVHSDQSGAQKVYSSKPPLLPTILAGEYLLLKSITRRTIEDDPFFVIHTLLIINNCIFLLFYFVSLAAIAELLARSDWTRFFILTAAAFGTYLTTFAVTLTNHLPATMAVAIALHQCVYIRHGYIGIARFVLCGLFAAFAAANELPATAVIALAGFICFLSSIGRTFVGFIPGVAVVVAGFFWTNHLAHDTWKPAYSFRNDGEIVARVTSNFEESVSQLNNLQLPDTVHSALKDNAAVLGIEDVETLTVYKGRWPLDSNIVSKRWVVVDNKSIARAAITIENGEKELRIRNWANWYEYGYGDEESPWLTGNTSGVDVGEKNQARYLVHLLIGHHGLFITMPVLIVALLGYPWGLFAGSYRLSIITLLTVAISIAVFWFYVTRPVDVRNYGGLCSAPRWFFWLIPMWLTISIPYCDWLARFRLFRLLTTLLLGLSVASANYSPLNPWVDPWPVRFEVISDDTFDSVLNHMLPNELDPAPKPVTDGEQANEF